MSGALSFRERPLRPSALWLSDSEVLLGQPICAADVFNIVRGLGACPAMATAVSRAQV